MIYQAGKYLRINYEGFGNIQYQVPDISASTLTAAADGTSVEPATPHIVRLGQDVGQAGNPAVLTENREIPLAGFFVAFSGTGKVFIGKTAADGTISILQVAGDISVENPNGLSAIRSNVASAEPFLQFLGGAAQTFLGAIRNTRAYTSIGVNAGGGNSGVAVSNPSQSLTAFGFFALANVNGGLTSQNNSAFGTNALRSLVSGLDNCAFGLNALEQLIDGNDNAVVGYTSLFQALHDSFNSALGNNIMVSVGVTTNQNGATGGSNTMMGYNAGGSGLTFAAATTLYNFCILLGISTGVEAEGQSLANTTIIGNNILTHLSNIFLLGRLDQNVVVGAALTGETDNGAKLQVRGNISGSGTRKAHRAITASGNFTKNDDNILVDSTAGNIVVTIDPTIDGIQGTVKKTSADVNTVTLQPASGTIQGFGAPAANYVFNVQGESVTFFSDGTNLYII